MIRWFRLIIPLVFIAGAVALTMFSPVRLIALAQQPTGSVPTVTGTPQGAIVKVYSDLVQVKVYSGPSLYQYPAIGLLLAEQEAAALGISEDGQYIQIYYPGVPDSVAWVYAPYVTFKRVADLQVLDAPPTPTPASTPTINPTLAAAFIPPSTPTRLPTFTPPPPLIPLNLDGDAGGTNRLPIGLLILGFGFIGGLGTLISFLRGR